MTRKKWKAMFNLKTHIPFIVWVLLLVGMLVWVLQTSEPYIMKIILTANFTFQLAIYIYTFVIKERLSDGNV